MNNIKTEFDEKQVLKDQIKRVHVKHILAETKNNKLKSEEEFLKIECMSMEHQIANLGERNKKQLEIDQLNAELRRVKKEIDSIANPKDLDQSLKTNLQVLERMDVAADKRNNILMKNIIDLMEINQKIPKPQF